MAKPLKERPPTSAVASALDQAGARVLAKPGERRPQRRRKAPVPPAVSEKAEAANIQRQFVLTETADKAAQELTTLFRNATGSRVNQSMMIRCVLNAVRHATPHLEREAKRLGAMSMPSTSDEGARQAFEYRITSAIVDALRAIGAYQGGKRSE